MEKKEIQIKKKKLKSSHIAIIDEYYLNGFNRLEAVRNIKGEDFKYNSAHDLFAKLIKREEVQEYIKKKQNEIKRITSIENINILNELLSFAYSDITKYINLSEEEIKQLPQDVKRCISSFETKTTTYLPRGAKKGEEVTEKTVKIKLIDKLKAIEMINKHIGFYAEDNNQKKKTVNVLQILQQSNPETLNALLNTITIAQQQQPK